MTPGAVEKVRFYPPTPHLAPPKRLREGEEGGFINCCISISPPPGDLGVREKKRLFQQPHSLKEV